MCPIAVGVRQIDGSYSRGENVWVCMSLHVGRHVMSAWALHNPCRWTTQMTGSLGRPYQRPQYRTGSGTTLVLLPRYNSTTTGHYAAWMGCLLNAAGLPACFRQGTVPPRAGGGFNRLLAGEDATIFFLLYAQSGGATTCTCLPACLPVVTPTLAVVRDVRLVLTQWSGRQWRSTGNLCLPGGGWIASYNHNGEAHYYDNRQPVTKTTECLLQ
jgi:hypothetical protein